MSSEQPISLGELLAARDRGDVGAVIEALSSTDRDVRRVAARSLRLLKPREALDPLIRLAKHASDEDLQILALKALAAIGDPACAPALAEIATNIRRFSVQVTAISALADLGDERAAQLLVGLVGDEDLRSRAGSELNTRSTVRWAVDRLADLGALEAVPVLRQAIPRLGMRERRRARRAIRIIEAMRQE